MYNKRLHRQLKGRWPGTAISGLLIALGVASAWADPPLPSSKPQDGSHKEEEVSHLAPSFKEKVEVVASPIIEGERVTPFATLVTAVTAQQVEDMGAGDLATALRRVPGVTISRYNLVGAYGGGDGGAVFLRGQGSGRPGAEISTLVDGVPRFVGVWTHPLLDTLSVDSAGAVELYKGAQPVLFGNMAFGVINLVPKRMGREGTTTRILGSFGGHATSQGLFEHGAHLGSWDYYLQAGQRKSDGHRPNAGGQVRSAYGRWGVDLGKGWSASLQLHGTDAWAEDPGPRGGPARGVVPRFAVKDTLSIATLAGKHGVGEGSLKFYWYDGTIDWLQWDAAKKLAFTTLTDFASYGVRFREELRLPSGTLLTVGVDHDRYGGSTVERRPTLVLPFSRKLLRTTATYLMVARTFGSTAEVTPSFGVRYMDTADFGSHWGWQAGVLWRRNHTFVYANLAHAINLPGVYTAVFFQRWGRGESWRRLEPEVLRHQEVGIGRQVGQALRLQLVAFSDRVTDALRFVPPPPFPPAFANLGSYTLRGAEASATLSVGERMALFGGVTYLESDPSNVPNAPRWATVVGMSWAPSEALRLHLDAEWVDSQYVLNPRYATQQTAIGSYAVIFGKGSYSVLSTTAMRLKVFLAGENLANAKYEYRPGYPAPGRLFTAGVEMQF